MNNEETAILKALPNLKINSFENLGEGDFCRAFLVNKIQVFRFAKHEPARQSLMRENCLLPKIAENISLRIPLPEISAFPAEPRDSFIGYRFLPDAALTREEYLKLDEKSRTQCAEQVAEFLNEIHAIGIEVAETCGIPGINHKQKYTALLNLVRENFSHRLDKADFEFAESEIENHLASGDAENLQPVLLHGDLSPDHVLFDGKRVTSIIDFGDLMTGDRAWDFLWIYEDYGPDFFKRCLARYDAKDKNRLTDRVLRFSRLEAIQWIADCLTGEETDLPEAVEHLRALKTRDEKISSLFDNRPEN